MSWAIILEGLPNSAGQVLSSSSSYQKISKPIQVQSSNLQIHFGLKEGSSVCHTNTPYPVLRVPAF